jgi:hypothetical protein
MKITEFLMCINVSLSDSRFRLFSFSSSIHCAFHCMVRVHVVAS